MTQGRSEDTGGSDEDDLYLTWEDFQEEEPGAGKAPDPTEFELPEDIRVLLAQKERLETDMKRLTGEAGPNDEDPRQAKMFAVKVHTKATRLEELRHKRRDERRRMAEMERFARGKAEEKADKRRAEREADRLSAVKRAASLRAEWDRQRIRRIEEQAAARRRHAAWAARRAETQAVEADARLRAESSEATARRAREDRRDAENRRAALRTGHARQQEAARLDERAARIKTERRNARDQEQHRESLASHLNAERLADRRQLDRRAKQAAGLLALRPTQQQDTDDFDARYGCNKSRKDALDKLFLNTDWDGTSDNRRGSADDMEAMMEARRARACASRQQRLKEERALDRRQAQSRSTRNFD